MSEQAVKCQACGGVFDTPDGVCTYCKSGVRFAGLGLRGQRTALSCPRCREDTKLYEVEYRGVHIDVCPECEGSWYDLGEIEAMVNAAREESKTGSFEASRPTRPQKSSENATSDVAAPFYIRCPHCDNLMARKNWESRSGILIDFCREHGIWLDGGELQRMRAWSASSPSGPPPPLQVTESGRKQDSTKDSIPMVSMPIHGYMRGGLPLLLGGGARIVWSLGRLLFGR